jgi:hypothetical protein
MFRDGRGGCLGEENRGRLGGDLLHLAEELLGAPSVVDPLLVSGDLLGSDQAGDGLTLDESAPLPIRAMELGRLGATLAARVAAPGQPLGDVSSQHVADLGQLGCELAVALIEDLCGGSIWPLHERVEDSVTA